MKLTFLGTGASAGVPVVSCSCKVCTSDDTCNHRLRTSVFLEVGGQNILVDAGPDLRAQLLRERIDRVDGVILTHAHYDHVCGLDELRVLFFKQGGAIPCLLSSETMEEVDRRFPHLLDRFDFQILEEGMFHFLGIDWEIVTYQQGGMAVNGFRLGKLAYISDIEKIEQGVIEKIRGVEKLIVSALRWAPSPIHLTVEQAIAFAREVGAKETWLIHMAHELDHKETEERLPDDIHLSCDGMTIEFTAA